MCASRDKAGMNNHRLIRLRGPQNDCENVFLHTEQQVLSIISTVFKCKHSRYSIKKALEAGHRPPSKCVNVSSEKGGWRNSHIMKFISI